MNATKSYKLTRPIERMLTNAFYGFPLTDGLRGRSEHGGAAWTRKALQDRGLLDGEGRPTLLAKMNHKDLMP